MTMPAVGNFKIVLIGSSTGGLPVIEKILSALDRDKYAVLVAQHMPEGFTGMWAEKLDRSTSFTVKEGTDGERIIPGYAYIAPGNRHMYLSRDIKPSIVINSEPPVNRFRPSIDVLFSSAIVHSSERIIAVILTGMCDDGVASMIELRKNGFVTIAQDSESSVVFGMNREAIERGGAEYVYSPEEIIDYLNGL